MRACLLTLLLIAAPALADGFQPVATKAGFLDLVAGKDLKRFGIRLTVTRDGAIGGRAFGLPVTGSWRWKDGFFCRELTYTSGALAENCQVVLVDGATLRFIADRGAGDTADLRID
ncbi:MAG: dihydrodipicolinate reductase [Paracoccaceae bacterium]